jgi:DNA-3-methyladenine glycosylase
MNCLPQAFYQDEVTRVARRLLGMRLVRKINGVRISGLINETEAYRGEEDLACHARVGKTRRNAMLYDEGGKAYVYFTYGMHWLANAVVGDVDFPAAVLIRSILPLEGIGHIQEKRAGRPERDWCNGPAKVCQSLSIDGALSGTRLFDEHSPLVIEEAEPVPEDWIRTSPRVGLGKTPEPWLSQPWRYYFNPGEVRPT